MVNNNLTNNNKCLNKVSFNNYNHLIRNNNNNLICKVNSNKEEINNLDILKCLNNKTCNRCNREEDLVKVCNKEEDLIRICNKEEDLINNNNNFSKEDNISNNLTSINNILNKTTNKDRDKIDKVYKILNE